MFSDEEIAYLRSQRLARLATVAADGQPTVDAVGFLFDGGRFVVGGHKLAASRKYRNIAAGNRRVALIVDDVQEEGGARAPHGIKVHGTAELVAGDGYRGAGDYIVVTPLVSWSWGILAPTFQDGKFAPHKITWAAA